MTRLLHPRLAARRDATRARSWWGKAWVRALEEAAYTPEELTRARRLARDGAVGAVVTDPGAIVAAVEDGEELWTVSCRLPVLEAGAVDAVVEAVAAEAGRVTELLAGRLPIELVEHVEEAGVELLPFGGELESECTCAAWVDPCPHALAVLSQLAWLLDDDPLLLLHLRGLPRDELLHRLHLSGGAAVDEVDADLELATTAALAAARLLELVAGDDPERHDEATRVWQRLW
jgi:uncharacterized Zn finger protein